MTKRFGFTLAEVLITLGIIGVVAAMTMPTLMNSTQGAQYKAAYKKALSALSQAVTLNVALDDYNFADLSGTDGTGNGTLATMLKNRMNVVREETTNTNVILSNGNAYQATNTAGKTNDTGNLSIDSGNTTLFMNDGIMFTFKSDAKQCSKDDTTGSTTPCYGFIDVNGIKAPNKLIKCDKGTPTGTGANACEVTNPTDVYPVVFYDQTLLPNSPAARAVLYNK
jgi:prepilin-type cleavage/methylation N-terminal domain protein